MSNPEMAYGREFLNAGLNELGNVMAGRGQQKFAAIVMLAAGVNGVFAGGTGKNKTELALAMPRLVHDIYPENVAEVPIQNDLTGMQLIGGASVFDKEITVDGRTTTERTRTSVPGIIKEDTQAVVLDEVNRGSTKTLESLLGMLETRRIVTLDGVREVPGIEYAVATLNPHETYESTQPVPHAIISRFSVGAIFDKGGDRAQRVAKVETIGRLSKDAKIEPITDLATIHRMREDAKSKQISASLERGIAELSVSTSDALWDEIGLDDGEERISVQVRKLARVITVLNSESQVNEDAVRGAANLVISARVGMAAHDAVEKGPAIASRILNAV